MCFEISLLCESSSTILALVRLLASVSFQMDCQPSLLEIRFVASRVSTLERMLLIVGRHVLGQAIVVSKLLVALLAFAFLLMLRPLVLLVASFSGEVPIAFSIFASNFGL